MVKPLHMIESRSIDVPFHFNTALFVATSSMTKTIIQYSSQLPHRECNGRGQQTGRYYQIYYLPAMRSIIALYKFKQSIKLEETLNFS